MDVYIQCAARDIATVQNLRLEVREKLNQENENLIQNGVDSSLFYPKHNSLKNEFNINKGEKVDDRTNVPEYDREN